MSVLGGVGRSSHFDIAPAVDEQLVELFESDEGRRWDWLLPMERL
ncbi:hypothetical protein [Actinoplanes hulinensis]|nr:hypothetical protein [Actinoplanes hulinensis]